MIGIFYVLKDKKSGPGKVTLNLCAGLDLLGVDYRENQEGDLNGCLHSHSPRYKELPNHTLMGPNLLAVPSEDWSLWDQYENFVVPSIWVKELYESFHLPPHVKISVWAAGIDTNTFCPSHSIGTNKKCLVYYKNGPDSIFREVLQILDSKNIDPVVVEYGRYTEDELIAAAHGCDFAFIISRTESQGIAYQEILSMGLPCYVVDKLIWDDPPYYMSFKSTAAPYFDERCGIKCVDLSRVDEFFDMLNQYYPRDYILDNLTLEKSARKYLSVLGN